MNEFIEKIIHAGVCATVEATWQAFKEAREEKKQQIAAQKVAKLIAEEEKKAGIVSGEEKLRRIEFRHELD